MKEPDLILGKGNITKLKIDEGDFRCLINEVQFTGTYSVDSAGLHEHYCIIESMGPYEDDKLDDVLWRSYDVISELIENNCDFQDQCYINYVTRGC